MSDPQGMPLTGNAPQGTTGHAANRHCPLEPAPAPVNAASAALMLFLLLRRRFSELRTQKLSEKTVSQR
jgi:hypothetical protein